MHTMSGGESCNIFQYGILLVIIKYNKTSHISLLVIGCYQKCREGEVELQLDEFTNISIF